MNDDTQTSLPKRLRRTAKLLEEDDYVISAHRCEQAVGNFTRILLNG